MSKLNVKALLKRIRDNDRTQVENQYEIANILTAIKDHKLYEQLGYATFPLMCRGELSFGPGQAQKYVNFYQHATRLRYKKQELLTIMQTHSWMRLREIFTQSDTKPSMRTISRLMREEESDHCQMGFNIPDNRERARISAALAHYGMEVTKSGRRINMSTALVALVDAAEGRTKTRVKANKARPKLKAVS